MEWPGMRTAPDGSAESESIHLVLKQAEREGKASCSRPQQDEEYAVRFALTLLQGKWKVEIMSRLQHGPARLSQLHRMFPAASKKVLTQRLREMEKDGLVVRTDLSTKLLRVEYSLSDSLGFAAMRLINVLAQWSAQYSSSIPTLQRIENRCKE
jgi:DNA-binding HxlR family transcriptional regulator